MIIDLRAETKDFRAYLSRSINKHVEQGKERPRYVHVGFTFDQDGWVNVYFDVRRAALRDGEWTTNIIPESLLMRPAWYAASELDNLGDLRLIGLDGSPIQPWVTNPSLEKLAEILGEFLRLSVSVFDEEGLFKPLLGSDKLAYCVEEFTGLYEWPIDPEIAKLVDSLKLTRENPGSHIV